MFGKLLVCVILLTVAFSTALYASPSLAQTGNTTQLTAIPVTTTSYSLQTQTNIVTQITSVLSSLSSSAGGLTNIPGFPIKSILLGVVVALVFLVVKRSKKH